MSVESRIRDTLEREFKPDTLIIKNVSDRHQGHAESNNTGESHFNITIVSPRFDNMTRIERQRTVMKFLEPLFEDGLHAVSLKIRGYA